MSLLKENVYFSYRKVNKNAYFTLFEVNKNVNLVIFNMSKIAFCRRATLVLLLCWLYSANHRRALNQWGVAYLFFIVFFPPPKGYRTLAEGIDLFVPSICNRTLSLSFWL